MVDYKIFYRASPTPASTAAKLDTVSTLPEPVFASADLLGAAPEEALLAWLLGVSLDDAGDDDDAPDDCALLAPDVAAAAWPLDVAAAAADDAVFALSPLADDCAAGAELVDDVGYRYSLPVATGCLMPQMACVSKSRLVGLLKPSQ